MPSDDHNSSSGIVDTRTNIVPIGPDIAIPQCSELSALHDAILTDASDEHVVTDPDTGGQKGSKLERFDLIPVYPLETLARHYGKGAAKYGEVRNWERGYKWSLSFAAMQRHAWAFWRGEDIDADNGMPHLAAVAFHAFALLEFGRTHPEKDDRVKEEQDA